MWLVISFIAVECFLPFINWFWLRTVTRIMFELKTEEMGGEGWIMCSFIICTACHIPVYQRTMEKYVRNVACVVVKLIVNRFLLKNVKENVHPEGLCDYGRIILKWILRNCIRMDFEYSCFGIALNDILINSVFTCNFLKILGSMLIRWTTIGIPGNTVN